MGISCCEMACSDLDNNEIRNPNTKYKMSTDKKKPQTEGASCQHKMNSPFRC